MLSPRLPTVLALVLLLAPALGPLAPVASAAGFGGTGAPAFSFHSPAGGNGAAEPSLGTNWVTGNALFQHNSITWRVVFDDAVTPPAAVWQNVRPPASIVNIDPILATDSVKGRTWAGGLNGECSVLMFSDNDGQSWNAMANPCASPAFDHETIGSGPWKEPRPATARWDRAVYYCAQVSIAQCARSDDGGVTFGPAVPVPCVAVNPGLHGSVHVDTRGHVWLPFKNGAGQVCVARSTDNGQTWTGIRMPGSVTPAGGFDPDVASTPGGWVYVGYPSGGNANSPSTTRVALTKDAGATWTVSPDLGASYGLKVTTFHEMVAGDDARAALAFLGTTSCCVTQAFADHAWAGVWHLYVAYTYDGGASWTTVRASEDPVQRGCIWDGGGDDPCRNLLDFMDAQVDNKGRVLVGFADGCINACALPSGTVGQSRSSWATIARQMAGRGLFAAHDQQGAVPLAANPGGPYAGFVGGAVGLSGSVDGGAQPYGATWSVDAAPPGSVATVANPNALATTFTPDVAGAYTLRLTVTDALGSTSSGTTTLLASDAVGAACGTTGVLVALDGGADGGGAGGASEVLCVRLADDAGTFHAYVDLAGTDTTATPLYLDLHLKADYAAGAAFLIEATWDGTTLEAYYADPTTFTRLPTKAVTATLEGSTLHLRTPRSELLSPRNGQKLTGVHVDANHCGDDACTTLVRDDLAPDARDGSYSFGSSPTSGGGLPLPKCSVALATDPAGDAANGNRGGRDLLALHASDDWDSWTLCATLRDLADMPAGTSQVQVAWDADYEFGRPRYFVDVNLNQDGTIAASRLYKGVAAAGVDAGPVAATRAGNVLEVDVPKGMLANPPDNVLASRIIASTGADGSTVADDVTTAASFQFGRRVQDAAPPGQVTGLTVTDLQTGSALKLAWAPATDDTGVTSYVVRRGTASGGPYVTVATPAGTTYTDSGLATGATYYYVVAAKDAAHNVGPESAEASGVPTPRPPDATPPSAPTDLLATGTESDRISVSWLPSVDPESGVAGYKVWRDGAFLAQVAGTTFTDVGLQPETTYLYEVAAVNGEGLESARATASAATLPLPPPDCGQTGYELLSDPDFDSDNGQLRSDVVRVSLRERDGRIWFHVGTRGMAPEQDPTRYRVAFTHAGTAYAVVGVVDDAGATPLGVYTTVQAAEDLYAEPRTSQDVVADLQCDSLILGVKAADVGSPSEGAALTSLRVEATQDAANNAARYDRAPNAGTVTFVVGTSNLPPILEPVGDKTVGEGELLAFTLAATDPNGDPVTFSAASLPGTATFDEATGAFSWTPGYADAATYTGVEFRASDGRAVDAESIRIVVTDVDTRPTLQPIGDRSVAEGATLAFTVLASDADGDALTLSAHDLPPGASFNAATGAFTWTAPYEAGHAAREHAGLRFEATDGRNAASETIRIAVTDTNRAPVLDPIGNRAVAEGATLAFAVTAADADGDAVTVTATGLPPGASFDGESFAWTPAFGDAGNHAVRFAASDGSLADEETVLLTVGDVNHPPTVEPIPDQTVAEGATLTLQVLATDADGQTLSYASPNLPPGATLHAATGVLTWTPGYAAAGAYPNVQVAVSDGEDATVATFAITVTNVDRAPALGALARLNLDETATGTRNVAATDPDGDIVTLTALGLPAWATFTDHGDGTGRVVASPPGYAEGTYPVTLRATSGALADEETFDIVVKRKVGLAVARVGSGSVAASPGQVVTLTATVTNAGSQADTFDVTTGANPNWARSNVTPLTLQPGESATATFTVTVPEAGGAATLTLTARSQASATVARSTSWIVSTPVTVRVVLAKPLFGLAEDVRGVATATWADGSPVAGATVRIEQAPRVPTVGGSAASSVSGPTDASGRYAFSFGVDPASRTPGGHDVRAWLGNAVYPGGSYSVATQ